MCSIEVNRIVQGEAYNIGILNANAGGPAENVLTNGGSENIPVTCNTGLYLLNNNNARSWFLQYFSIQKRSDVGFGAGELFSAAYFQQTVGYILTTHLHAIQRGDTEMEAATSEWLRAYWSFITLAASAAKPESYIHTLLAGPTPGGVAGRGYGVTIVGTRNYVSQVRATGAHYLFLSLALDNPGRSFDWSLDSSPGNLGGIRAFLLKAGYHINSNGQINFTEKSLTSRQVGISDEYRNTLKEFINTNGNSQIASVLNGTRPYGLRCEITFLRTTNGIITWFGNSEQNAPTCSVRKGGSLNAAAYVFGQTSGNILTRVRVDNNPTMGETWRNGQRICANAADMLTECIDIPTGNTVYEVSINSSGISCKAGNCNGGGGVPPTPTPIATPTPVVPTPTPTPGGPAIPPPDVAPNCNTNALCLLNGRFQVQASWQNQFNNSSGIATRIKNTDISGFLHFGDSSNVELIVKILDFGSGIKFFYGQLTNLKFNIKVTDTLTGTVKYYQNTAGDCGGIDNNAFVATGPLKFKNVASHIISTPNRAPTSQNCTPNANTLCLQNGRVKITATWRNHFNNTTGNSFVKPISQATGGLYFSDLNNLELLVKALDFGDHYLIMYGTLSNLEYTITATDMVTGRTKDFFNSAGNYCGGSDASTFVK